ncbi:MAG: hypothetical protein RIC56_14065 [Pseudomonadales bacterium]
MGADAAGGKEGDDPPRCWNCDKPLDQLLVPVSRHEYCPHCAEAVHCCRSCVHFAPTLPEQCREDRADPPTDRTAANFCDFFALRRAAGATAGGGTAAAAQARLEALFGSAPGADATDHDARERRARSRLDELFGDETERD